MQLFEGLRYKPGGRGFNSDGVVGIFHLLNPSTLWSTQPLTEMITMNISWGIKTAGA